MTHDMSEVDFALLYIDGLPDEYFDELRSLADENDLNVVEEPRENVPYAAMEWVIPTLIAVYIGGKFVEAFAKRAADDVAATAYPKFKKALKTLAERVLIRDRAAFRVISSEGSPHKLKSPDSLIFSVYAESKENTKLKFIFHKTLSAPDLALCIDQLMSALCEHFSSSEGDDALTLSLADNRKSRLNVSYLVYDAALATWDVVDPSNALVRPD